MSGPHQELDLLFKKKKNLIENISTHSEASPSLTGSVLRLWQRRRSRLHRRVPNHGFQDEWSPELSGGESWFVYMFFRTKCWCFGTISKKNVCLFDIDPGISLLGFHFWRKNRYRFLQILFYNYANIRPINRASVFPVFWWSRTSCLIRIRFVKDAGIAVAEVLFRSRSVCVCAVARASVHVFICETAGERVPEQPPDSFTVSSCVVMMWRVTQK